MTPVGVGTIAVWLGALMAVEKVPPTGVLAGVVEAFWLARVEKSVLVRVLRFCPETGTGTEAPPVVLDTRATCRAGKATLSLKFASNGRICCMSF